jgi:hypothetical protein
VRTPAAWIAAVLALLVTAHAFADPPVAGTRDPLDEARALQASLDYERALVIVDREIARGAANRSRLVELELLAGTLAAGIDHPDVAQAHFARVLALAPETRLPDGTSPKITAPFEAAKATTPPLAIAYAGSHAVDATTVAYAVTVGPDPAQVADGLRAGGIVAHGREIRLALATTPRAVTLDVIDEHGNSIAELAVRAPAPPSPRSPAPSIARRWWPWAIAAGTALAGAGVAAWRFTTAQDEWNQLEAAGDHGYSELAEVESRGRAWAIAADVGVGVAAAAAVVAIVMLATSHDTEPAIRARASGEGIGFALRF